MADFSDIVDQHRVLFTDSGIDIRYYKRDSNGWNLVVENRQGADCAEINIGHSCLSIERDKSPLPSNPWLTLDQTVRLLMLAVEAGKKAQQREIRQVLGIQD